VPQRVAQETEQPDQLALILLGEPYEQFGDRLPVLVVQASVVRSPSPVSSMVVVCRSVGWG
jgi:hypothetical protein